MMQHLTGFVAIALGAVSVVAACQQTQTTPDSGADGEVEALRRNALE